MKFHVVDGLPTSVSPSSHASEADGFVFLTGQFGRDDPAKPLPEGIRAQTDQTLRKVRRVLELMRVTVFLTHFKRDYDVMNEVHAGFFPKIMISCVQRSSLRLSPS